MQPNELLQNRFRTNWDELGHFPPRDVPVLFPKSGPAAQSCATLPRTDSELPRGDTKGGRPKCEVPAEDVRALRQQGFSWRQIGRRLGIGHSTAFNLYRA